jgi:RNA polymerase sigma-70 factor, ECF subfamily
VETVENRAPAADATDVALALEGDGAAFERLYRRHAARIHTLTRRMVGEELADDVTQEVFIRAWEKLELFGGRSSFGTWLYRVAINVCLAQRATASRWWDRFRGDEVTVSRAVSPRRYPEARVDLERAVAQLPARARQVFVLHDVEGYKHREIGEMLGITVGTSKSQLHEARMTLRGHLGGRP